MEPSASQKLASGQKSFHNVPAASFSPYLTRAEVADDGVLSKPAVESDFHIQVNNKYMYHPNPRVKAVILLVF